MSTIGLSVFYSKDKSKFSVSYLNDNSRIGSVSCPKDKHGIMPSAPYPKDKDPYPNDKPRVRPS